MRLHCANNLVVLRICAVARTLKGTLAISIVATSTKWLFEKSVTLLCGAMIHLHCSSYETFVRITYR